MPREVLLGLALSLVGLGACHAVEDIALEVREVQDLPPHLATDPQLEYQAGNGALSCASLKPVVVVTALCVELYTLSAGRTTTRASCHDAPQVRLGLAQEPDLNAYLRGLGTLADGIAATDGNRSYVRVLGYSDAQRASLAMCGITPSFPQHLDLASAPPTLALYLICRPDATHPDATPIFDDYCGTSGFVTVFP